MTLSVTYSCSGRNPREVHGHETAALHSAGQENPAWPILTPTIPAASEKRNMRRPSSNENIAVLADLGYRLYAENRRSLLLVLQGMDTAGKDGTIRHVMRGFNPQSCQVTSFKQPGVDELAHDFLWRISRAAPRKGFIGIFNRSHYEDVLVVRVHNLVPKKEWESRYERINLFEETLAKGGTAIVKVFLHISKEEQRRRLQARLDDPKKRWKFSRADLQERRSWDDYQRAYEVAMARCNAQTRPLVHRAGELQVVPQSGGQPHIAQDAGADGPPVSPGRRRTGGDRGGVMRSLSVRHRPLTGGE